MGKHLARNFAKGLSFLVIGVLIFMGLQRIFIPKHLPYDKTYDIGKLGYFSGEEKDSIDVLICGTSHASRGIMPMEMYESYGIRSYNLAVSRQPLPASYYTLREALDSQNPKVIVWDVSNLYMDGSDPACWKLAMDEMAPGGNRRQFVEDYLEKFEGGGGIVC